jgi:hypothetical protein
MKVVAVIELLGSCAHASMQAFSRKAPWSRLRDSRLLISCSLVKSSEIAGSRVCARDTRLRR